jgi:hypothetical protein
LERGEGPDRAGRPARPGERRWRVGIAQNLYYRWSKKFLEAGKTGLAGVARAGCGYDLAKAVDYSTPPSELITLPRKLEHQTAVEIEPQRLATRFTPHKRLNSTSKVSAR